MTISNKAVKAVKESNKIQAELMIAFNLTQRTIENWLDRKDDKLTTYKAMKIIKEGTGLKDKEILVSEKELA